MLRAAQTAVRTVACMRIVLATAEPLGAYHLSALASAMTASPHQFTHLIPYDEKVQGTRWHDTTASLAALLDADRLVVTGGGFSAWTALVAAHANSLGVSVLFSELAFVPTVPPAFTVPRLERVSAVSRSGSLALATYLGVPEDAIVVTGNPLLDAMPAYCPDPSTILVVSTVMPERTDPDGQLRSLAARLKGEGLRVRVRCHPREDVAYWAGFDISLEGTIVQAAAGAQAAVGYLGSASPPLAALGVPFVVLDPVGERESLPFLHKAAVSAWTTTADGARAALAAATPVARDAVEAVTGPLGGSAERVVSFWTAT